MVGTLIGIDHQTDSEVKYAHIVESCFRRGRTFWTEAIGLFPILERKAKRAGMKVRSLDSKFARNLSFYAQHRSRLLSDYITHDLRERSWLPRIKRTTEKDVILMHPYHALQIAIMANIPKRNIRFIQSLSVNYVNNIFVVLIQGQ